VRLNSFQRIFVLLSICALASTCIADPPKSAPASNGISVGKPKVFDNRTLTLMLESLSQTLQSMQSQFIDQKSLAAALANIQGYEL